MQKSCQKESISLNIRTGTVSWQFNYISVELKIADNQYCIISMQSVTSLFEERILYNVRVTIYNVIARLYNVTLTLYNIGAKI